MIKAVMTLAIVSLASVSYAEDRLADVPAGYKLIWSDEFDRDGSPDTANWLYDTEANRTGWYNNELQYYAADRLENAAVAGGSLVITARREALVNAADYGGQSYTSARLITRGKAQWTYGFFEVRAKLPCGAGSWPAIWMLGTGKWPDAGEIDIMEHVGNNPGTIHSTVHNRATAGTSGNGNSVKLPDACNAFHRYQLEWTQDALRFAVDGRLIHRYERTKAAPEGWPFAKPQYLLLNLAIGGDMAGKVDDRIFPQRFEIDYVRVYQIEK